jgi:16S rRNA (cytidine1402-2'-O)-methyltransferase
VETAPEPEKLAPGFYLVAGPIGNLGDITLRALEILRSVDRIACEDTRHSGKLLSRYEIRKPLISLHAHNEAQRTTELIERIQRDGESIGYLSDAGSPAISDPGERLVHRCIEAGVFYDVLPGPSAVITALIGAGLGATPFFFAGFLPTKKGQRRQQLLDATEREHTTVFFESPHRIVATLEMLAEIAPEQLACVARELTKRFQDYRRGLAQALFDHYRVSPPKGEICLLVGGSKPPRWLKSG